MKTPRLRAFETNERTVAKIAETMDPCFVGRNAAVLQYTRFAYTDQATRRRISNRAELSEASLILTSVKPELTVGGTLRTRNFGYEEIKKVYGDEEDQSAVRLIIPNFPKGARTEEQGPSNSKDRSEGDDGQGGSRRSEEPMQQDPDQAEQEADKASTGGISSLDFNFLSDFGNNADALETTEPANEGTFTLEPPSAFVETNRDLPECSSPGNSKDREQRLLMESPRRRRIEGAGKKPFLGPIPEEEREVHQRDHKNRTGCRLDRVAFMEEVSTVVQSYGTQSILKVGPNRPLMREVLDKLDEFEGRLSELLIDSATDKSEAKLVIDKINEMKMKLGSKVVLRKASKTKVDSEISIKAVNSAKKKASRRSYGFGTR